MSSAITSVLAAAPIAAARPSVTPAAPRPAAPTRNTSTDTVELSEAQRVHQAFSQGQSIPRIASSLGVSVAAVDAYLGISKVA